MTDKEKYVLEHYKITRDGKVYSPYTKKYLKFREDKDGYYDVTLIYNDNGDRQPFRVHRLVALKYLPEVEGYNVTNHKDLNKKNNNVENLEWSNVSLNTQHGFDNCAYSTIHKIKVSFPDGTILVFPSESHVSRYFNYKNPSVINKFSRDHIIPSRGKLKGCKIEYTNESVTTIERITSTVTSE